MGGVGFAREPQVWMRPGDVAEVVIDKIGTLRNEIASEAVCCARQAATGDLVAVCRIGRLDANRFHPRLFGSQDSGDFHAGYGQKGF